VETTMLTQQIDQKLSRALELVGPIDPEIAESWPTLAECVLAQALENVELAEQRLRKVQELVGERALVEASS
jgi:hypothetical protein